MEKKIKDLFKTHWFPVLFAFVLALGFILVFSSSTSPLSYYYNGDSTSVAITVARGWYYDFIPYKDLFTIDGPWMYFLGKVGISFAHGNKTGIAIIQVINLFLFLLAVYCITTIRIKNTFYSCFVLILTCAVLKNNYPDGMYAEEFLLPWFTLSLYSFLTSQSYTYPKSLLLGISVGITCMCASQYLPILLVLIFVYLMTFLLHKQWKDLLFSILCIAIGIMIILLPFIIYFKKQNCFDAFIYDVFTFQKDIYFDSLRNDYVYKKLFLLRYPVLVLFTVSILSFIKKRYNEAIGIFLYGCIQAFTFYQMNLSTQYSMFIVGNIALLTNAIFEYIPFINKHKAINILSLICMTVPIYFLFTFIYPLMTSRIYSYQNIYHNEGWEGLLDNIDSEDYNSLMFYGTSTMNNSYLLSNQMPCYKYFYDQETFCENDEVIKENIYNTFKNGNAKWIIANQRTDTIQDILDSRYQLIEKDGMYSIYLRKE